MQGARAHVHMLFCFRFGGGRIRSTTCCSSSEHVPMFNSNLKNVFTVGVAERPTPGPAYLESHLESTLRVRRQPFGLAIKQLRLFGCHVKPDQRQHRTGAGSLTTRWCAYEITPRIWSQITPTRAYVHVCPPTSEYRVGVPPCLCPYPRSTVPFSMAAFL